VGCVCESRTGKREFAGDESDRASDGRVAVWLRERSADCDDVYWWRVRRGVAIASGASLRACDEVAYDASEDVSHGLTRIVYTDWEREGEGSAVAELTVYFH